MLRSHAGNGNECQTPCHRHSAANIEITGFWILVNPNLVWNSWKLACYRGAASTCCGNFFVPLGVGLGICFSQTRASHNKHDGFGRGRPTFGDETISIASYCFQNFSCVKIEQQECCVNFRDFSGSVLTFLCTNWVFNAFMCIIEIWTTCTCSSAYKLDGNEIFVLGCMLRSHARNGNEFQTFGHRWLPAKHWDDWFLNSSSGINMPW